MRIFPLARRRASAARTLITPALAASLAAGCASVAATPASAPAPASLTCTAQSIPVSLAPYVAARITGQLCARGDPSGRVLEVAIPGATYGESYWNFPYDPAHYSYAQAASSAGYAVLAINRPGTGSAAGDPPAADLTIPREAWAVHQVIAAARRGALRGGSRFPKIILVGHSLGSYIALAEAATYGDVSGLILTGATHRLNLVGKAQVAANTHPAADDPAFRGADLPPGYITSKPPASTRAADFYAPATTNPHVVQVDEQLKTTATVPEIAGISAVAANAALSRRIRVPVLLAVGQDDKISCGPAAQHLSCATAQALLDRERAYYNDAASLSAYVLRDAGHAINLATDASHWFAASNQWIGRYVATPAERSAAQGNAGHAFRPANPLVQRWVTSATVSSPGRLARPGTGRPRQLWLAAYRVPALACHHVVPVRRAA